jgi:hypothetical protein
MNTRLKKKYALGAAALLLGLGSTLAAADTLPAPKRFGTATYLSGGLTKDEAQAMQSVGAPYNLRAVFIAHTGQYLADVPVSIRNERGDVVFDGVSEGPMLWLGVPPGRYVVTAQYSGRPQAQRVEVGSQMRSPVYFRWQVSPIDSEF